MASTFLTDFSGSDFPTDTHVGERFRALVECECLRRIPKTVAFGAAQPCPVPEDGILPVLNDLLPSGSLRGW